MLSWWKMVRQKSVDFRPGGSYCLMGELTKIWHFKVKNWSHVISGSRSRYEYQRVPLIRNRENYQTVSRSALAGVRSDADRPLVVTPDITSEITWPSTWWRNKSVDARPAAWFLTGSRRTVRRACSAVLYGATMRHLQTQWALMTAICIIAAALHFRFRFCSRFFGATGWQVDNGAKTAI